LFILTHLVRWLRNQITTEKDEPERTRKPNKPDFCNYPRLRY